MRLFSKTIELKNLMRNFICVRDLYFYRYGMIRVENEKEGHFLKEGQNNITHYCLFLSYVFVFLCINQDKFIFKNFKKYITHLTIFLEHVIF